MPRDTSRRTTSPAQSTTPSGARNRRGSRNTWPFSSPGLPSTPSRDAQALGSRTNNETGLPEENAVTVDSSIKSRKYPPPLPMICWHRANGIPCKGKPGQSSEARHLLCDHSMSDNARSPRTKREKENLNHHTLSGPCERCGRLFASEERLKSHYREDERCDPLAPDEPQPANEDISQTGATKERMYEIKRAMEDYGKSRALPPECKLKDQEIQSWVARNTDLYVGQSKATPPTAAVELGKWFIGWYMFFPRTEIPDSPFVPSTLKSKAIDLFREYLEDDFRSGKISHFEPAEVTRILFRAEAAIKSAQQDEIQRENAAKTGSKRKRLSDPPNSSSSPALHTAISHPNSSPWGENGLVPGGDELNSADMGLHTTPKGPFPDGQQALHLSESIDSSPLSKKSAALTPPIPFEPQLSPSTQVATNTSWNLDDHSSSVTMSSNPRDQSELHSLQPADITVDGSGMPTVSYAGASNYMNSTNNEIYTSELLPSDPVDDWVDYDASDTFIG